MGENDEILRIYAENEAEISAIWERLGKDKPETTMADAVREWLRRQAKPNRQDHIDTLTKQRDALTFAINELIAANFAELPPVSPPFITQPKQ